MVFMSGNVSYLNSVQTFTGNKTFTGTAQFNGNIGFYSKTPIAQPTDGATLTNNITPGGSANTLADFISLTVYATDAAAIRNNEYQLGLKLKTVVDNLRALGLET